MTVDSAGWTACATKLSIIFIAGFTMLATSGCGQREPAMLTVCEVLAKPERYANSAVAVVGQMERSVSIIDHYEFLSQDQCDHPMITNGHRWEDKIQVWGNSTDDMPAPPADRLRLNPALLVAKLSMVRKTTKLRSHDEPTFKSDGKSTVYAGTRSVKNEWAVVYGRVVKNPGLDNVPLMMVVKPYNVYIVGDDGVLRPVADQ